MNKQTLTGTVGDDHRVNQVNGTTKVARFPLATYEVHLDKEGNQVQKTECIRRSSGTRLPASSKPMSPRGSHAASIQSAFDLFH